jgi:GT2 family glycosyltransferase
MPAPLVSIIIPAFITTPRQADLLAETLGTVGTQTSHRYEVIVVDDGSPLDLKALVASHGRVVTLRQHNGGPAVARNAGLARSRGEYLVFLDGDDHLLPWALEVGVRELTEHPECGFAVGPREEMTFEGDPVPWTVPPPPTQSDLYLPLLGFEWYIIPPSSAMFRRSLVERIGGFQDPWGADDLDFYLRAARASPARCYQAPVVTRYRRYSTSSSRDGERMLYSVRAVYQRQWPLIQGNAPAEAAYHRGLRRLTDIFVDCLRENIEDRLRAGDRARAVRAAKVLGRERPELLKTLPTIDAAQRSLLSAVHDDGQS